MRDNHKEFEDSWAGNVSNSRYILPDTEQILKKHFLLRLIISSLWVWLRHILKVSQNLFLDPLTGHFYSGKVIKPDDFRDLRNLAASPKSFSWFWSTLSWKKKYLKILKIAQRGDLSIPHNIYSHSSKHRFRGFHPIKWGS